MKRILSIVFTLVLLIGVSVGQQPAAIERQDPDDFRHWPVDLEQQQRDMDLIMQSFTPVPIGLPSSVTIVDTKYSKGSFTINPYTGVFTYITFREGFITNTAIVSFNVHQSNFTQYPDSGTVIGFGFGDFRTTEFSVVGSIDICNQTGYANMVHITSFNPLVAASYHNENLIINDQCTAPPPGPPVLQPPPPPPVPPVLQPSYLGYLDLADCGSIAGWAADLNKLNTQIAVSIYADGNFLSVVSANQYRPDVGGYIGDGGLHGFSIPFPESLRDKKLHSISVKFDGEKLELNNSPKTVTKCR